MNIGTILLGLFLVAILAFSFVFAFQGLSMDVEVPASGTAMLFLGGTLSVIVGVDQNAKSHPT